MSRLHKSTRLGQMESQGEIATIHKPFLSWLHKNNLLFVYHRPDKRSGIATGWPDFTICHCGRCLLIEAKKENGKLSEKQVECVTNLRKNGNTVVIARSAPQAISAVQTWLGVEKPEIQPPERSGEVLGEALTGGRQSYWIAGICGVDNVFSGDPSPGGLATKIRRATPQDLRDLPRK